MHGSLVALQGRSRGRAETKAMAKKSLKYWIEKRILFVKTMSIETETLRKTSEERVNLEPMCIYLDRGLASAFASCFCDIY